MRSSSVTDVRVLGSRTVAIGITSVIVILLMAAFFLVFTLPDAGMFNARVEALFVANNDLTSGAEIKLLEILAGSGTAFYETLEGYRMVILALLIFATALIIAALTFLLMLVDLNKRMATIERAGMEVNNPFD